MRLQAGWNFRKGQVEGVRLTHQRTADQLAPPCIANRNGALTFTSTSLPADQLVEGFGA